MLLDVITKLDELESALVLVKLVPNLSDCVVDGLIVLGLEVLEFSVYSGLRGMCVLTDR